MCIENLYIDKLTESLGGFLTILPDGTPGLIAEREALENMLAAGSVPVVIINLAKSLADFRRLAGGPRPLFLA